MITSAILACTLIAAPKLTREEILAIRVSELSSVVEKQEGEIEVLQLRLLREVEEARAEAERERQARIERPTETPQWVVPVIAASISLAVAGATFGAVAIVSD